MKILVSLGVALALAGCASPPEPIAENTIAPAANPQSQIRHTHGQNLFSGYTARPVKGPEDWRKLNDQQSPARQEES